MGINRKKGNVHLKLENESIPQKVFSQKSALVKIRIGVAKRENLKSDWDDFSFPPWERKLRLPIGEGSSRIATEFRYPMLALAEFAAVQ